MTTFHVDATEENKETGQRGKSSTLSIGQERQGADDLRFFPARLDHARTSYFT